MTTGAGTVESPRIYASDSDTANAAVNSVLLTGEIRADPPFDEPLDPVLSNIGTYTDTEGVRRLAISFDRDPGGDGRAALDALVAAHTGTPTSLNHQFWESGPAQSTSSHGDPEVFETAFSKTAAALRAGTYRFSWYFELKIDRIGPLNSEVEADFLIGANVKGSTHHAVSKWTAFSGWDRIIAAEGVAPAISIRWRRDPLVGGNDHGKIRKMKLSIEFMG